MMNAIRENAFLSRWADLLPRAPGQLGAIHEADAELVPLGDGRLLALTVDTVAEEIRTGLYRSPRTAGRIAACASLSDLAAVGAEPVGMLLAVSLPRERREAVQREVASGVADVCRAARTFVLGGDTSEGDELWVAVTAVGLVPSGEALLRVGCRPGDLVFAGGPLGAGAALAAVRFLGGPGAEDAERAFHPPLRLEQGRALRGLASACIDTSDGLVAALDQLARLNGVRIELDRPLESLLDREARALQRRMNLPAFPFVAAHHGEFELVFTVPSGRRAELQERASQMGWAPIHVGYVFSGSGVVLDGRVVEGARIRNLLSEVGGDIQAYARALVAMGG